MTTLIILILLMLAAFGLGWLMARLFSSGNTTDNSEVLLKIAEREYELEACRKNNISLAANVVAPVIVAEVAAPIVNTWMDTNRVDDLKIVEGVGSKIEELLKNSGIATLAQLAGTSLARLNKILEEAGPRHQMHDPSTWAEQANLANGRKWDELKIFQDKLNKDISEAKIEANNASYVSDKVDDLKIVEGIGPKIEELLINNGIKTYAKLADTSVAQLKEILQEAGPRFQIHDPGTWPQQTALARDGNWTALKILQDNLNKGKVE